MVSFCSRTRQFLTRSRSATMRACGLRHVYALFRPRALPVKLSRSLRSTRTGIDSHRGRHRGLTRCRAGASRHAPRANHNRRNSAVDEGQLLMGREERLSRRPDRDVERETGTKRGYDQRDAFARDAAVPLCEDDHRAGRLCVRRVLSLRFDARPPRAATPTMSGGDLTGVPFPFTA